jgi:hypothetical protein
VVKLNYIRNKGVKMTFIELFENFLDGMGVIITDEDLLDDALVEAGFYDGLDTEIKTEEN